MSEPDGLLSIIKPANMTSFDVVAYLRRILKIKKIGHTGTLDPNATGVLVVCVGKSTGIIPYIENATKTYTAEMLLGTSTDTQDIYGKVLSASDVVPDESEIRAVFDLFKGDVMQIPGMYSAIKINGQKLYEIARKGGTADIKPRKIHIFELKIRSISGRRVLFDVKCSKGTYVRTLCSDIGDKLGCGAVMSFLMRIENGGFNINNSVTLEETERATSLGTIDNLLISPDIALMHYDGYVLNEMEYIKYMNGVWVSISNFSSDINLRIYTPDNLFIGIGETFMSLSGQVMLRPKKRL